MKKFIIAGAIIAGAIPAIVLGYGYSAPTVNSCTLSQNVSALMAQRTYILNQISSLYSSMRDITAIFPNQPGQSVSDYEQVEFERLATQFTAKIDQLRFTMTQLRNASNIK